MVAALQRWHRLLWALPLLGLMLAGCARPVQKAVSDDVAAQSYSGRLSLSLQTEPPQSFFAGFDLRGSPQAGELVLATPLGSTLARISWTPASARLLPASGEPQQFADLPALMQALTGTAVPVAALFDWLSGREAQVPGWQPDLSLREQGRLSARRDTPAPAAELRLILD